VDISFSSGSIAVVTILLNGKGQRLGDLAAGTTVITEKKQLNLSQTLSMDIPDNYMPHYPQVTLLKDRDIQNIKSVYQKAKIQRNHRVIISLSEKISKILEVHPEERPEEFVQNVLRDYSFYTQQ
jgi:hypothetical protein